MKEGDVFRVCAVPSIQFIIQCGQSMLAVSTILCLPVSLTLEGRLHWKRRVNQFLPPSSVSFHATSVQACYLTLFSIFSFIIHLVWVACGIPMRCHLLILLRHCSSNQGLPLTEFFSLWRHDPLSSESWIKFEVLADEISSWLAC